MDRRSEDAPRERKMLMKPIKRAVHFDFHTMPGIDNFGENFDAEVFAQQLADAHVEYVNMFGQCNIGFCYYDTKAGIRYPYMKGDMLRAVVEACHKRGIGVSGYLNVGLNHEQAIRHPEWLQMNKDGQIYNLKGGGGNFFRTMCYNTGYKDFVISIIKEMLDTGVDGIFCDCMLLRPCYCMNCTKDMLAREIDINSHEAVTAFSNEVRMEMCRAIRAAIPDDKRLFLNGLPSHTVTGLNSHMEIECLPAAWSYDYFTMHASLTRTLYDNVVYMNGRFQTSWGDFGGYKGKAAIENDFFDALTQGVSTSLGDHLHPAENAITDVYRDLGEIYEKIMAYEAWTDGAKYVPEMAVLMNSTYLGAAHQGAARMLSELKYAFDIVRAENDFSGYKLLILPDDIAVDKALGAKLSAFLAKGGKILSTGTSALTPDKSGFALPEWDFEFLGLDESNTTYFALEETPEGIAEMPYSTYTSGIRMAAKTGNRVFASSVASYFKNTGWDGLHYYFYTPPKEKDGGAAVLMNAGGNVAHVSFPIFSAYFKSFASVFKSVLDALLSEMVEKRLLLAKALPSTARATVTRTKDYSLLHVKVTYPEIRGKFGIIEEHNVLPAGKTVGVLGEYKEAYLLPEKTPVPFTVKDGYTHLTLPEITGYAMFLLK